MPTIARDELDAFLEALRRLLTECSSEADVRRTMDSADGIDAALWQRLAEMGVPGLLVDAAHGGVGAGPVEIERVMEEAGAALLCGPLLSTAVLATGLLQAIDDADARARLLPLMAQGRLIATVALTGPAAGWVEADVAVQARPVATGWRLDGVAAFVTHAQVADLLLECESAVSAARHAAACLADQSPEAEQAVSLAAFACADAFTTAAATGIQMHGGIAFTWAHPAHLYLRRARADAQLFGAPAWHRERFVRSLGG